MILLSAFFALLAVVLVVATILDAVMILQNKTHYGLPGGHWLYLPTRQIMLGATASLVCGSLSWVFF